MNIIIGFICGFAGGMNLVVGNTAIGVINILLSFINFFIGYILIKRKKEEERLMQMYQTNISFKKGVWNNGETERKNKFGMESSEDWLAQLCQQSKRPDSKQT